MTAPHITVEQLLQHQDWLHRFVRRMVRDDFTADDMVQATFAEALESPDAGKVGLRSWLAGTARNLLRNQWRSNSRRRIWEEKAAIPAEVIHNQSTELADYFTETNKAISELPEPERQAIMFRYLQEMKPREIAREMGIPVEVVYRLLENSRGKLRNRLERIYGKDWQAMGIGLIALHGSTPPLACSPTNRSFIPSPIAIGVGAALFLAGAVHLGPWGEPVEHSLGNGAGSPESLSIAALPDQGLFEAGSIRRGKRADSSLEANGFVVHARSSSGTSVPGASLTLTYADGTWADYIADSGPGGSALFDIPEDAEGIHLYGQADGLWTVPLSILKNPGKPQELVFFDGTHEVVLPVPGAPLGTRVLFSGKSTEIAGLSWFGSALTDQEESVRARLPGYGIYQIQIPGSYRNNLHGEIAFTPSGVTNGGNIRFHPPGSLQLQAIADDGSPLQGASFFVQRRDENLNAFHAYSLEEIPSSNGFLEVPVVPVDWAGDSILVRCNGFRDATISLRNPARVEHEITLHRESENQSSLAGILPGGLWTSLQMQERVPCYFWKDWGSLDRVKPTGLSIRQLQVSPEGNFRLPRPLFAESHSFSLKAIDDSGVVYILSNMPGDRRREINPVFQMTPDSFGVTTVAFHPPPVLAGSRLVLGSAYPIGGSNAVKELQPDSLGRYHLDTRAGDRVRLCYETLDITFDCEAGLPAGVNSGELVFPMFEGKSRLYGEILLADGSTYPPSTRIKAVYLDPLPGDVEGATIRSRLTVTLSLIDGVLKSPDCPPGRYRLSLPGQNPGDGPLVTTYEAFRHRIPPRHRLIAQARDSITGMTLSANLFGPSSRVPGRPPWPMNMGGTDAHLTEAEFSQGIPFDSLVIAAKGYEPLVLSQAIPNIAYEAFLTAGRGGSGYFDLPGAGITLDQDSMWICRNWGAVNDPRQVMISVVANRVYCQNLPAGVVELEEVDMHGQPTGRVVVIDEVGSIRSR